MIYIGQDDTTCLIAFIAIIIIIYFFGMILRVITTENWFTIILGIVLILLICVLKYEIDSTYKIKIVDKNITVDELTDKFIIKDYDVENDIWYVYEKDGGYSVKELNNDNN